MAAKRTASGNVSARIYFTGEEWDFLQRDALDIGSTGTSTVRALVHRYRTDPELRAQIVPASQALDAERRGRA